MDSSLKRVRVQDVSGKYKLSDANTFEKVCTRTSALTAMVTYDRSFLDSQQILVSDTAYQLELRRAQRIDARLPF